MDVEDRAAQVVFPWIPGRYAAASDTAFRRIQEWVELGIGGVVVSIGSPHAVASKLNLLQERAEVPLLVTSDFESGGPGMRLGGMWALPSLLSVGGGTELPATMAFGAIRDLRFTRQAGRITGREARAVGVHMTLAPVADLNTNPENPIIGIRAFGEDPEAASRRVEAFVAGAREAGLLTAAKHFPGHGDTRQDSHLELPAVGANRARLDSVELVPFRRAVEAGVDGLLTAHIRFPAIPGQEAVPATFSSYFLTRLLREEWGFRGLVVTDALRMAASSRELPPGEAAVRSLAAGADVLLGPAEPREAVDAVARAVRDGRVAGSRLEEAVRRILEAKVRAGLHRTRQVALDSVARVVGSAAHRAFADTAAVRSLTLPLDEEGLVPVDTARTRRILSVTVARPADLTAGRAFERTLREGPIPVSAVRIDTEAGPEEYRELDRRASRADLVVVSVYLPPSAGEGSVSAPDPLVEFLQERARSEGPLVLVSFGNPYLIRSAPEVGTYLVAWGGRGVSQRAAARALLGRASVSGRMPVTAGPVERGDGLERRPLASLEAHGESCDELFDPEGTPRLDAGVLEAMDARIRRAVADSVTPGAALAVGRGNCLARLRGYGRTDWDPAAPEVTDSTIYDLASLTKPVATATAIMQLVEDGRLALDAPVSRYLPGWRGGEKDRITVGQLLLHRGGLPPFRDWWREREGQEAYRRALSALEPVVPPGDTTVYSDLGYMALGLVAAEVAGAPLDRYLARSVYGPLGLSDTGYRPPESLRPRVAPTEVDTVYRGTHVHGEVHDENAHAMGGVAGHAGLFSSARDMARLARFLLNGGWGGGRTLTEDPGWLYGPAGLVRILGAGTVREFTSPSRADPDRAPGWRTDATGPAAPFGAGAFGHTGFTGTSLWVDPARDLFVVLLTNRVNPLLAEECLWALRRVAHVPAPRAFRSADAAE
jgi:beta-glucosidase-like glycosyl hydrolase/CubicO group peptidase (beta-lactamase class C family)